MAEDIEVEEEAQKRVIFRSIEEEMKTSYIDYAMSVIVGRALPDARDGLKPVHRRVLFGMQRHRSGPQAKLNPSTPFLIPNWPVNNSADPIWCSTTWGRYVRTRYLPLPSGVVGYGLCLNLTASLWRHSMTC